MFTLGEIIDVAIRIEKNGRNTYRKAQGEVSSSSLASMLQWLADDEAEHEEWFSGLKEKVGIKVEDPKLEEMGRAILQNVLGDRAFSITDADFSKIENVKSLLELSIEFEKDTIIFYEMLRSFMDDIEVLSGLDKIIEEESRHVKELENLVVRGEALPLTTF
ncbi:MAG: ferritin family protein [Pseudomonadota bacterium]|nr:ferritin family protein [Desulfobacterales bacterium]MBL6968163.1 ferritin family protein [Desulfobacteraceae bacterium]